MRNLEVQADKEAAEEGGEEPSALESRDVLEEIDRLLRGDRPS